MMQLSNLSTEDMASKTPLRQDHLNDIPVRVSTATSPEVSTAIPQIVVLTAHDQRVHPQVGKEVANSAAESVAKHSTFRDYLTDTSNATRMSSATCAPSVVKVSTTLLTSSVTPELIQVIFKAFH